MGLITCISCLTLIAHITLITIIIGGKGSFLNTHITFITRITSIIPCAEFSGGEWFDS